MEMAGKHIGALAHTHQCVECCDTDARHKKKKKKKPPFEILFLSTKTIKSSDALMLSAAPQVTGESVPLS